MGKSILVIDTTECCERCDLGIKEPQCDIIWCGYDYVGRPVSEKGKKPDWCPLHDAPQKKRQNSYHNKYEQGHTDGWNDCLDHILNGD